MNNRSLWTENGVLTLFMAIKFMCLSFTCKLLPSLARLPLISLSSQISMVFKELNIHSLRMLWGGAKSL